MNNINKNHETYNYKNDKKYFVEYYNKIAEKGFTLYLTYTIEGYCFIPRNNIVMGLDKYNFDKSKFGMVEFFNKEQLDEIIQIEINMIRFNLIEKQKKMFL